MITEVKNCPHLLKEGPYGVFHWRVNDSSTPPSSQCPAQKNEKKIDRDKNIDKVICDVPTPAPIKRTPRKTITIRELLNEY